MRWELIGVPVAWSDGRRLRPLNRGARRLLGEEDCLADGVFDKSAAASWSRLVARCQQSDTPMGTTLPARDADGKARLVQVRVAPDGDGELLVTFEDHTPQRRELEDARRSSRFLSELLDQTPTIFFVVDRSGQLVFRNAAFRAFVALDADLVSPATLPQLGSDFHAALAAVFEHHEGEVLRVRVPDRSGGVRQVQLDLRPLRGGDGRAHQVLVIGVDLTEVLEAHGEQRRLQGELAQARRLEALGQMAGTIAHDFNNFLTVIQASSGLLRELLTTTDEDILDTLEDLDAVTVQAQGLTRDLVAFSRSQMLSVRDSSLGAVLAALQAALPRLVPPSMEFHLALPDATVPAGAAVPLSESQCLQIAVNLVQNAVEATKRVGRVEVRLHTRGGDFTIEVADDGPGVPREQREQIFQPFFTTRSDCGGTGLGLSSTRTLCERAGGSLEVEQSVYGGALFRVRLPLRT